MKIKFPFLTVFFVFLMFYVTYINKSLWIYLNFFYHVSDIHFIFNLIPFLLLGGYVENKSRKSFIFIFLFTYLIINVILAILNTVAVGMSSVIYGFFSYFVIKEIVKNLESKTSSFLFVLFAFLVVLMPYQILEMESRNVFYIGHVVGLMIGVIFSIF
jgi:membrane associated rhomboid family serine protease